MLNGGSKGEEEEEEEDKPELTTNMAVYNILYIYLSHTGVVDVEWHPVLETSLNTGLLTFNNLAFWLKELCSPFCSRSRLTVALVSLPVIHFM